MRSWVWYFEPGVWLSDDIEDITWLDIEARKFPYFRRWQAFMIGLGYA